MSNNSFKDFNSRGALQPYTNGTVFNGKLDNNNGPILELADELYLFFSTHTPTMCTWRRYVKDSEAETLSCSAAERVVQLL